MISATSLITAFLRCHRLSIVFGSVYLLLSLFVMLHFLHSSLLDDIFPRMHFESMYEGTAWKPFVYRVLIPKATYAITEATPQPWQDAINDSLTPLKKAWALQKEKEPGRKIGLYWLNNVFPDPDRIYPRLVATLLIYGCLLGYIFALWRLAASLFPADPAIHWFAPVFGLLIIPSFSWQFHYLYDIPVLFLSTACFYFMLGRRFGLYLLCFLLACLNKESSIIIFLLFAFWFWSRLDTRRFAWLCMAQIAIYALIKISLVVIYRDNPGWLLEDNLGWVLNRDLLSRSGYQRILVIAWIFFLLTFRWQGKPLFLKYALLVLPFFYLAYLLYGYPGEYRVFFDVMPLLVLLATHTLIEAAGFGQSRFFCKEGKTP